MQHARPQKQNTANVHAGLNSQVRCILAVQSSNVGQLHVMSRLLLTAAPKSLSIMIMIIDVRTYVHN